MHRRAKRRARVGALVVALAAIALAFGLVVARSGRDAAEVAPGFTLPEAGGRQVSLSEYRGKPVAIVFFRTFT